MKKTWAQKLKDKETLHKVLQLEKRFPCYNGVHKMGVEEGETVVLVNPSEIIPIMAAVPRGKLISIREICRKIARSHGVKGCCTLTTGIFIMTIANAVEEAIAKGEQSILTRVPYWRTVKAEGFLNRKYPGGLEAHRRLLEGEGFDIISRGSNYQVTQFQEHVVQV